MGLTNAEKQAAYRARYAANKERVAELEAEVAKLQALRRRDLRRLKALVKLYRVDTKMTRAIFDAADKQAGEG